MHPDPEDEYWTFLQDWDTNELIDDYKSRRKDERDIIWMGRLLQKFNLIPQNHDYVRWSMIQGNQAKAEAKVLQDRGVDIDQALKDVEL